MEILSFSGTIHYDGSSIGTNVKRLDLIDEDLIVFDWISPTAVPTDEAYRLLGVAEKQADGTFKSPWIYLSYPDGSDGARIVFQVVDLNSSEIRIVGEWVEFDEVTKHSFAGLLMRKNRVA